MSNRRIIRIMDGKIFINPDTSFTVAQTTFPTDSLIFSPRIDRFLEVELHFVSDVAIMIITNYNAQQTQSFFHQNLKLKISRLEFRKLNWEEFSKMLFMYKKQALQSFFDNESLKTYTKYLTKDPLENKSSFSQSQSPHKSDLLNSEHKISLARSIYKEKIKYKDAIFNDGYVTAQKRVKWHHRTIDITVHNDFLKKEFDSIKYYFGKKINGKDYFTVDCHTSIHETRLIEMNCTSSEITQINPDLIEAIKIERIVKGTAVAKDNINKHEVSISCKELNESLGDDPENVLALIPEEIVQILSNKKNIRNKAQLEYLSKYKHSVFQNLRYTLRPSFGFLFYVEGKLHNHYCWELLDKNATYIWSISTHSNQTYQRIDKTLSYILSYGRKEYKNQYKNKLIDQDIIFNRINHKDINNGFQHNFEQWKSNLHAIVII